MTQNHPQGAHGNPPVTQDRPQGAKSNPLVTQAHPQGAKDNPQGDRASGEGRTSRRVEWQAGMRGALGEAKAKAYLIIH
ncbi:MAG: hypothetical protein D3919_15145 [Candidatus Electrothrix sp. AW5]|nr:hypothetical protein [Candidatus Electrothrix gigas]